MGRNTFLARAALIATLTITAAGCGGGGGEPITATAGSEVTAGGSGSTPGASSTATTGEAGVAAGVAKLAWDPPQYPDQASAPRLSGYRIHFGKAPDSLDNMVDVGDMTTYTVSALTPGTYYFAVSVYDAAGNESGYSNVLSKVVQ